MKNKFNNIFQAALFSWILIFGSVYANTNCNDQRYSICFQTGLNTETTVSSCISNFQDSTAFSAVAGKKDVCCKDKICKSEGQLFFRTQNSSFQKQSVAFVYTLPKCLNKNRALTAVFDHHKTIQTIPIYTIIQSFLC
ncbi:MAG: hypothetical protein GY857_02525 [Desulfobacula sp.]|nr:hypothetical protein [Desulfobacula sp.]